MQHGAVLITPCTAQVTSSAALPQPDCSSGHARVSSDMVVAGSVIPEESQSLYSLDTEQEHGAGGAGADPEIVCDGATATQTVPLLSHRDSLPSRQDSLDSIKRNRDFKNNDEVGWLYNIYGIIQHYATFWTV